MKFSETNVLVLLVRVTFYLLIFLILKLNLHNNIDRMKGNISILLIYLKLS